VGEIPTAFVLKQLKREIFTKYRDTYKAERGGSETGLQNCVKPLYNSGSMFFSNPMQLEEDLCFEPHDPNLKACWMTFKNLAISDVPEFANRNDKNLNKMG